MQPRRAGFDRGGGLRGLGLVRRAAIGTHSLLVKAVLQLRGSQQDRQDTEKGNRKRARRRRRRYHTRLVQGEQQLHPGGKCHPDGRTW